MNQPQQKSPPLEPGTTLHRPLRLLQVLGYAGGSGQRFGITGVERVVQVLLEGLPRSRYAHYVAYPAVGERFETYRRHAHVLDLEPHRKWDWHYVRALARTIRSERIDLVVSHGLRFDFLAQVACRRADVPHVVVRAVALADEPMSDWMRRLYGFADRWTLGSCRGIVAVSEASRLRMMATQRLPGMKIAVIPNGVRLPAIDPERRAAARRALGVSDDAPLVGGMGQLIPRKAFHVLVDALGILRTRYPRLEGAVLGEGPEREQLTARAQALGLPLHLPGYVADPYPTLAAFDVAVLPSRAEGMPLVVLEAMALQVACVATPAAGTVELIEDGRSGFLFPMDDPEALAAVLDRLLANDTLRARVAAAGMDRAQTHFGLDAMLSRFDAYLHTAAGWPAT